MGVPEAQGIDGEFPEGWSGHSFDLLPSEHLLQSSVPWGAGMFSTCSQVPETASHS